MYQGKRAEAYERNRNFPFDPKSINAMVLSHAHIDHSGNIPNLIKQGYDGEILCTYATRDLCAAMLMGQRAYSGRRRRIRKQEKIKAWRNTRRTTLSQNDARMALDYFSSVGYERQRQIAPGVTATLRDAGHMLGNAFVVLDIEDFDDKRHARLVFSGDLGRAGMAILRDPFTGKMIGNCFSHAVTKRISFAPRPGALTTFGKPEATGKSGRALR